MVVVLGWYGAKDGFLAYNGTAKSSATMLASWLSFIALSETRHQSNKAPDVQQRSTHPWRDKSFVLITVVAV